MQIIEAILTENPCFKEGAPLQPQGLMLHSVGTSQPSAEVFVKKWNKPTHTRSCVHAFIDANDGAIWQTLPWDIRAWHCGKGSNGSGNNTHIGIEMCEPATIKYTGGASFTCSDIPQATATAMRTYKAAVEIFAALAIKYGIDPKKPGAIISHSEGHKLGIASNHADPEHLWRGLGMQLSMDQFRDDVAQAMQIPTPTPTPVPQKIVLPTHRSIIGQVVQLEKGDALNVRTGPGMQFPNLIAWPTLNSGNAFEILGTDESRAWFYINIKGAGYNEFGWVYSKFVEI